MKPEPAALVAFDEFLKLDIRVGRVVDVQPFPEGKYSTHVLQIDFGTSLGIKKSLAKLAPNYSGPELNGTWRVLKLVCWNEIDTKGPRLQSLGCQTFRQVHGGPFDVSIFVKTDSKSST